MQTFADLTDEIPHFKRVQDFSYMHVYSVSLFIPDNTNNSDAIADAILREAILGIEEDATFYITHISGAVIAPATPANPPARFNGNVPLYPMAGCSSGRCDRGIDFRITDLATGRDLTKASVSSRQALPFGDFIPFEALFTPGYSFNFFNPVPFEYFMERGRYLRLQIRNRNSSSDEDPPANGAFVNFAFLGNRMQS